MENEKGTESKQLALKRPNVARALPANRFTEYGNMIKLLEYSTAIAQSEFSPFSKPEDVAAALIWANSKNISEIDALSHLIIVNGKVVPDSYLTSALIMRESTILYNIKTVLTWNGTTVREDCRPLFMYKAKSGTMYNSDDLDSQPNIFQVVTVDQVKENIGLIADRIQVIKQSEPYDYRTIVQFKRQMRLPDGTFHWIEEEGQFTWSEAFTAKLTTKQVWEHYLKDMLFNRAFTRGSRRIAKDLILKDNAAEALDLDNVPYDLEDGEYMIID